MSPDRRGRQPQPERGAGWVWYNCGMHWIFLSPHLDDAPLSCGGLIWQLVKRGDQVENWTLFAGDPPPNPPTSPLFIEYHTRWGIGFNPLEQRRAEDVCANRCLGARERHFSLQDAIYRTHPQTGGARVPDEAELFGGDPLVETELMQDIRALLAAEIPPGVRVVCPMTIGGHIDHRLTRLAAEGLGLRLWYYADFPYAAMERTQGQTWRNPAWKPYHRRPTRSSLPAWGDAIACYASQITSFWRDEADMRASLEAFWRSGGGLIWR